MNAFAKIIFTACSIIFAASTAFAQEPKEAYGIIDMDGKIFSPAGKHLGWVTNEGSVKDSAGTGVAQVNTDGNLIENKTGKSVGKVLRNGNYTPVSHKSVEQGLTVLSPIYGTCEVKNERGATVVVIHEHFKQFGAAAYHLLYIRTHEKEIVKH